MGSQEVLRKPVICFVLDPPDGLRDLGRMPLNQSGSLPLSDGSTAVSLYLSITSGPEDHQESQVYSGLPIAYSYTYSYNK